MLPSDQSINVVFSAAQWNTVMLVMAEAPMPHRITDPLIRGIQQQCMAAAQAENEPYQLHPVDNLAG